MADGAEIGDPFPVDVNPPPESQSDSFDAFERSGV